MIEGSVVTIGGLWLIITTQIDSSGFFICIGIVGKVSKGNLSCFLFIMLIYTNISHNHSHHRWWNKQLRVAQWLIVTFEELTSSVLAS